MTEEGRAEADKARDSFNRRLAAAQSVGEPAEIDWATYKAKLPDVDVDAIKRDYEATVAAIPALTYDDSADKGACARAAAGDNTDRMDGRMDGHREGRAWQAGRDWAGSLQRRSSSDWCHQGSAATSAGSRGSNDNRQHGLGGSTCDRSSSSRWGHAAHGLLAQAIHAAASSSCISCGIDLGCH